MGIQQFIDKKDIGILEAPEDVLSTMTRDGKRRWMYPIASKGRYYWARMAIGWGLIAIFVLLPIIRINGRPAILLDLLSREFTFFGTTFYPTDTFLLLLWMVGFLLFIVLFTALLGRVWCGWACPQTVYMEYLYRPIERLIEGNERARSKRDEGKKSIDYFWRKGLKYALFLIVSLFLAHTFVAYFVGWDRLIAWMQQPPTEQWGYFVFMAITTGMVLFDFAYFREQMCTIVCPYARIQSVLLDEDSLIVSYDPYRGEPRGRGKKREGLGDCIDCFACVRTCPTGIDIRDGLQMECIACTQCIDACDDIMDRVGQPRGLIRYTSENALEGRRSRITRPRVLLYSGVFALAAGLFLMVLTNRGDYDVNVGRATGAPYMEMPEGEIANRLRFRVRNQTGEARSFEIRAVQPAGADVRLVGTSPITLDPGDMTRVEAWIVVPPEQLATGQTEGEFELVFDDGSIHRTSFTLIGPRQAVP
jgi:cytochrome c oxidase accessory protein FixG